MLPMDLETVTSVNTELEVSKYCAPSSSPFLADSRSFHFSIFNRRFLDRCGNKASNKQRNIGILFAYIAFNIFLALVGFYLYSVRSHKQVTPKKKSDSYSSNNEVGSENEKEQPLSKTGSSEAEAETGGVTPAADPSTRPSTSASPQ